ncbi:PEP-CTERM sorting domain-containing protein [Aquabacterium sp.]|uniref:PEP-CTERM sorting domain-containing protein n=1 Tax=Aquabacterium sp. TaxID=1872578 RepID=UPI0037846842
MLNHFAAKLASACLAPLLLSAAAVAAPVRYQLTDVQTITGNYQTGRFGGSGSLLGYFVFDAAATGIGEFIITAVENNAVQFEWSSAAGAPHSSVASSFFDADTGAWNLRFNTGLGINHEVMLDLTFRPSDFDFGTGTIPLITGVGGFGSPGGSNWFEVDNFQYEEFAGVTRGSLAVPEPATGSLVVLGGLLAWSLARRRAGQRAINPPAAVPAAPR